MPPLRRSLHQGVARVAAQPDAAADGAAPRAEQLSRQPRHLAPAPRHGQRRPARVDLLLRSASRCRTPLCGFYAAAFTRLMRAVRHRRAHRGGRLPRHRRAELRAEGGAAQRSAGGGAVKRIMSTSVLVLLVVACRACAGPRDAQPPRASSSCRSTTSNAKGASSGSAKRRPCSSPTT